MTVLSLIPMNGQNEEQQLKNKAGRLLYLFVSVRQCFNNLCPPITGVVGVFVVAAHAEWEMTGL